MTVTWLFYHFFKLEVHILFGLESTVKTCHQKTRLLKSGCLVSYKWTKKIKHTPRFLISTLNKKVSILHAGFCQVQKSKNMT